MDFAPLEQAIRERAGLLVATGGTQADREQLCRHLTEQSGRETCVARLNASMFCEDDLVGRVLAAFGVVSDDETRSRERADVSLDALVAALRQFLIGLRQVHGSGVLVIEHAQNLPLAVFDGVGLLSDLETDGTPLLQIVLVGTPALLRMLRARDLAPLGARVSLHIDLAHGLARLLSVRMPLAAAVLWTFVLSVLVAVTTAVVYQRLGF